MVMKMWEFEHKISLGYGQKSCTKQRFFRFALSNSLIGIKKPTLVAMVTKISELWHKLVTIWFI